jgi:hypothetical protein
MTDKRNPWDPQRTREKQLVKVLGSGHWPNKPWYILKSDYYTALKIFF